MQATLSIRTAGPGLHEFTDEVASFVRESGRAGTGAETCGVLSDT